LHIDNQEANNKTNKDQSIQIFAKAQIFCGSPSRLRKPGDNHHSSGDEQVRDELEEGKARLVLHKSTDRGDSAREGDEPNQKQYWID